jgi:hypothetical protein
VQLVFSDATRKTGFIFRLQLTEILTMSTATKNASFSELLTKLEIQDREARQAYQKLQQIKQQILIELQSQQKEREQLAALIGTSLNFSENESKESNEREPEKRSKPKSGVLKKPKSGRPKGSKNKTETERNYGNKMSLKEAVWEVLGMGASEWTKHLDEYPEDGVGLKASEIRDIINNQKIWESSSNNIGPQITGALIKLKDEGKINRGDDKRYHRLSGQEL